MRKKYTMQKGLGMEYKKERFKGVDILRADEGVRLVRFMNFECEKDSVGMQIRGKRKITLVNLDMKPILTYVDSWDKNYFNSHNVSNIYCYKDYFVRQIDNFKMSREQERIYVNMVYDYEGNLIRKNEGNWLANEWKECEKEGD